MCNIFGYNRLSKKTLNNKKIAAFEFLTKLAALKAEHGFKSGGAVVETQSDLQSKG